MWFYHSRTPLASGDVTVCRIIIDAQTSFSFTSLFINWKTLTSKKQRIFFILHTFDSIRRSLFFFSSFFSYFALTHDCTATCDCTIFNSNNVLTSAWKIKAETFSSRLGRNKHENSKKLKHCWRFVIRLTWAATWPRKEFRLSSAFSIESESTREQRTLNFYSFLIELRCERTLASKWNRCRPHVTPHQS